MKQTNPSENKFDLSNIKTAHSRNGFSMSATLLINGIAVCDFTDKGDGSEPDFDIYMNEAAMELYAGWEAFLENQEPIDINGYEMKVDKGFFIDLLHAAIINKKDFKLIAA